ncbi:MAG: CYTH domain-containing protein [Deltaproteobacteria bacterium]
MAKPHPSSIETELKYSLTKTEYARLEKHLNRFPHKTQAQTNYYFDTPSLALRKLRGGLRIRTVGRQKAILTLKLPKTPPKKGPSSLKVRYEFEEEIPIKVARQIINEQHSLEDLKASPIKVLKSKISNRHLSQLHVLGSITNKRIGYRYSKDLFLELDRYCLFDQVFYELEVETDIPEETDLKIRKILKNLKIAFRPSKISKLQRFFIEWAIRTKTKASRKE